MKYNELVPGDLFRLPETLKFDQRGQVLVRTSPPSPTDAMFVTGPRKGQPTQVLDNATVEIVGLIPNQASSSEG